MPQAGLVTLLCRAWLLRRLRLWRTDIDDLSLSASLGLRLGHALRRRVSAVSRRSCAAAAAASRRVPPRAPPPAPRARRPRTPVTTPSFLAAFSLGGASMAASKRSSRTCRAALRGAHRGQSASARRAHARAARSPQRCACTHRQSWRRTAAGGCAAPLRLMAQHGRAVLLPEPLRARARGAEAGVGSRRATEGGEGACLRGAGGAPLSTWTNTSLTS